MMATKSTTTKRTVSAASTQVETGSANVFADLGLDSPDERQLRVKLAMRLNDLIQSEGLSQSAAAKHLGLAQPHISELNHYKLSRFSSERLMHLITLLNRDVEIFIRPRTELATRSRAASKVGQVSVWATA